MPIIGSAVLEPIKPPVGIAFSAGDKIEVAVAVEIGQGRNAVIAHFFAVLVFIRRQPLMNEMMPKPGRVRRLRGSGAEAKRDGLRGEHGGANRAANEGHHRFASRWH